MTTVKQLKKYLDGLPDETEVLILRTENIESSPESYFVQLDLLNAEHIDFMPDDNTLYIGEEI